MLTYHRPSLETNFKNKGVIGQLRANNCKQILTIRRRCDGLIGKNHYQLFLHEIEIDVEYPNLKKCTTATIT